MIEVVVRPDLIRMAIVGKKEGKYNKKTVCRNENFISACCPQGTDIWLYIH